MSKFEEEKNWCSYQVGDDYVINESSNFREESNLLILHRDDYDRIILIKICFKVRS